MKKVVMVFLAVLLFVPALASAADRKPQPVPAAAKAEKPLPKKLDLNRVSREELVGIPGIGPRMAQAIIDLRTKKGSLKRLEELLEVAGIKEKKLASLGAYLEIIPPETAAATSPATLPK